METFWDRLRGLMEIHKISYSELSTQMDLSPSYLSAAIARNNEPRAEFAYKVAKKFGVSLYWLIAGEDENAIDVKFAPVIKNDRVMEIAYNLHKCSEDFVAIIEQLVAYENSRAKRA